LQRQPQTACRPGIGGKIALLHSRERTARHDLYLPDSFRPVCPVAARRPLRRQDRQAASDPVRSRLHAPPREGGIAWLQALSQAGFAEIKPFSNEAAHLLDKHGRRFSEAMPPASRKSKRSPTTTSRRSNTGSRSKVKDVPELVAATEFIHFACTSEDINNTSHGMMLKAARDGVMLPALQAIIAS
jgi:hypothetical protein